MGASEQAKAIVRSFVEAANERDYDALEAIVSPSFERHCQATPDVVVRNFEDFRRFLERDVETFPDARVTLETLVAEGNLVAFWATLTGTQSGAMGPYPPSGKRAEVEFGGIFRIEAGRITQLRLTWDNMALLAQLGHFPLPSAPG
jgi:steroid delta-isomerase-like uncharacterized protein